MSDPTPHDLESALEAEIADALGDMSIEDMMDLSASTKKSDGKPSRELKKGTVVSVHGDDVFVEFGPKAQGVCPITQFPEPPQPGEVLDFIIERIDSNENLAILSRRGATQKADWGALDVGQVIEAMCTGVNKGGLEMEVANHRAFMPAGQVGLRHIDDLSVFVGQKLKCEVIELDRQRGRIILSQKKLLEAEREAMREELMDKIEVGRQVAAKITSIQPFGAFADIGGVDGLIHISDLSYDRVKDPSEVVKVGDEVQVKILKIDTNHDPPRIGLGMKQTMADPYVEQAQSLEVGGTVSGKVTKIAQFGAFVELAPGVEGLVHVSELAHERVNRVNQVVKEGEIVKVKILDIDQAKRRISLSIKALTSSDDAAGDRADDPQMKKLRAQLNDKFGDNLRGGLF